MLCRRPKPGRKKDGKGTGKADTGWHTSWRMIVAKDDVRDALGGGENLVLLSPTGSGEEVGFQKAAGGKFLPGCSLRGVWTCTQNRAEQGRTGQPVTDTGTQRPPR